MGSGWTMWVRTRVRAGGGGRGTVSSANEMDFILKTMGSYFDPIMKTMGSYYDVVKCMLDKLLRVPCGEGLGWDGEGVWSGVGRPVSGLLIPLQLKRA